MANDPRGGPMQGNDFDLRPRDFGTRQQGKFVGPPLQAQLTQRLGGAANVAVQGVNYNASVDGAITGFEMPAQAEGAINMAGIAKNVLSVCPATKVILSGYSQDAEQVHGAMQLMGADGAKINSLVTFGDPQQSTPFMNIDPAKTKVFCAQGDGVCAGQFAISQAHLSYGMTSIAPATDFIMGAMGSSAAAVPAAAPAPAAPAP